MALCFAAAVNKDTVFFSPLCTVCAKKSEIQFRWWMIGYYLWNLKADSSLKKKQKKTSTVQKFGVGKIFLILILMRNTLNWLSDKEMYK